MGRSRRGVGYCQDPECDEYSRGVFLLNHTGGFDCPVCGRTGHVEREQGWKTGDAKLFKEVRVEYAFDAEGRTYREVAIVQDVSLWGRNNIYTLRSPLIRTEKRALKVAEAILANLNRAPDLVLAGELPSTSEVVLSFDEPIAELQRKLVRLAYEWEHSGLSQLRI